MGNIYGCIMRSEKELDEERNDIKKDLTADELGKFINFEPPSVKSTDSTTSSPEDPSRHCLSPLDTDGAESEGEEVNSFAPPSVSELSSVACADHLSVFSPKLSRRDSSFSSDS
jgi:hypothetical protein